MTGNAPRPASAGGPRPPSRPPNAPRTPLDSLQALMYEPGTHIMASGALAALSGAKTGRSPRDKRVVREPSSEADVWWADAAKAGGGAGNGSPNYEMDEHTFLLNRERAVRGARV